MRITQRAVALTSLQGLNRNLDAVGKLQQQLTSGRLINAPSDSPTGTNRAMQTRADQAAIAQQERNISDAKSWLEQTDSTPAGDARHRPPGARPHRPGPQHRLEHRRSPQALATEVKSLRDGLLSLANRTIQGPPAVRRRHPGRQGVRRDRHVRRARPGRRSTRRVSDTEVVRVDITGPEAFGAGGGDLFAIADRSPPT